MTRWERQHGDKSLTPGAARALIPVGGGDGELAVEPAAAVPAAAGSELDVHRALRGAAGRMLRVRYRHEFGRRVLFLADLGAGATALTVLHPPMLVPALPALGVVVFGSAAAGLYRRDEHLLHKTTLEEASALLQVATIAALVAMLVASHELSSAKGAAFAALLFGLLLTARAAGRSIVQRVVPPERCLVVGEDAPARWLRRKFAVSFSFKAQVVGRVSTEQTTAGDTETAAADDVPILGGLPAIAAAVREHRIDRVIVMSEAAATPETISRIEAAGVKVSVLPRVLELVGSSLEFDDADGLTLLGVRRMTVSRSSSMIKRGLDLAAAGFGLVLLAPLLAGIAAAIKFDSKGPVLYRQKRVGRGAREFSLLKFRSMVEGADLQRASLLDSNETHGLFKIGDDPRVTRVGRFLRRSSLDELPQLWNVLRGEMSIVGPRPLIPEEDAKIHGWQRKRETVAPGMTGIWQILGSTRVPLDEMVRLDYLYGARWSVWLDIKIVLRTISYVVHRRSA